VAAPKAAGVLASDPDVRPLDSEAYRLHTQRRSTTGAMASARVQVARFSSGRCREIEAALITRGYLEGKLSKLELQYPVGGVWHVRTNTDRAVIAVSVRPDANSQWVLKIQAAEPIRPQVVYRNPPSESQLKRFEHLCYEVALVIHEALQPLCPDLRWEAGTGDGALKLSGVPIPPGS
jgi:hypothetical protein